MTWAFAVVLLGGIWSTFGLKDSTESIRLPPQVDVALKEVTPTTVTIICTVPLAEANDNTKFRVEFGDHRQDSLTTTTRYHGASTEIRIENLRPATSYTFRVRASNDYGLGDPSNDVTVTTRDIREPFPPRLNSDPHGTRLYEYTATWETPETGGLPIREYKYRYRQVDVDEAGDVVKGLEPWMQLREQPHYYNTSLVEHKIMGLHPGSQYQLEVTFRNAIGWSLPNDQFIFRTGPDAHQRQPMIPSGTTGVMRGQSSILSLLLTLLLLIHCMAPPVLYIWTK